MTQQSKYKIGKSGEELYDAVLFSGKPSSIISVSKLCGSSIRVMNDEPVIYAYIKRQFDTVIVHIDEWVVKDKDGNVEIVDYDTFRSTYVAVE